MPPIIVSADVGRSADDVYAYTTDPSRFGEWQQGVVRGHMELAATAEKPRCVTVRRIGFAERASTSEVVRADPPRAWSVRGIDGPIRALVNVSVTPLTHVRSRVTISVDFEGHGVGKLLVPLAVRRQARKEMPTSVATLKRRLESES
ncbi:MAG TPA: SRPBCC family protein [Acidothermaceae bacterium]